MQYVNMHRKHHGIVKGEWMKILTIFYNKNNHFIATKRKSTGINWLESRVLSTAMHLSMLDPIQNQTDEKNKKNK